MPFLDKLLVFLCSIFIGLSVALLYYYENFKSIAEIIVIVTGVASFTLTVFDFFRKK